MRLRFAPAVAIVVLIAGCGSSSNSGSGSGSGNGGGSGSGAPTAAAGRNAIARAAYVSTNAAGYRFTMSLTEGVPQLGGQITGTGTGSFSLPKHAGEITMNMRLPGAASAIGSFAIHEVISGQNIFMQLPTILASRLPGGKPWIEMNLAKVGKLAGVSNLSSLTGGSGGTDPAQFLAYLRATSAGGIKNLGTATIDGTSTTHYRGSVDLAKATSLMPAAQQAQAKQAIAQLQKLTNLSQLPVDVYVDAKNLVRRMALAYKATVQGQAISTAIRLDFLDYGPQPTPATPPAGQVTDLTSLLSGLKSSAGLAGP